MSTTQEHTWLSGRELLVREIGGRVQAVRSSGERRGALRGFRAGLVVFLERRFDHLREVMAGLRQLTVPLGENRRQSLDRMVSAVVGTLRHVEIDLDTEGPGPEWSWTMTRDQRQVQEREREPEREERQAWREHRPRKGGRTSVPASDAAPNTLVDGDPGGPS